MEIKKFLKSLIVRRFVLFALVFLGIFLTIGKIYGIDFSVPICIGELVMVYIPSAIISVIIVYTLEKYKTKKETKTKNKR